jgi:hypothetical protein
MQHTDYLSKTEDSIYFVIDKLKCYTEEGFIASLYVREYSDLKVSKRLTEVRQCLSIVHFEYLNLVDYSLRFNKLWATDDNNRFTTAQRMFRMLKTSMESLKRKFRKSCPISHSKQPEGQMKISVFEDSVLTRGGCARDLFGIESFKNNIQALFYEQRALFTNVLASLLVCRDVIRQEEIIRADKDHCVKLLVKQCNEIITDLKNSIKFTQAPVTCKIQKLIEEIGLGDAAQRGFHNFGLEDVTEYALFLNAQRHQPNVVSLNIGKCYQKATDIQVLFRYFKEFRPEPTKKKPSALKVLFTVNWMGGTDLFPNKTCYDLLAIHFEGALPKWHTVSTKKNDIPDLQEQQQLFNAELYAFIAQKKVEEGKSKAS